MAQVLRISASGFSNLATFFFSPYFFHVSIFFDFSFFSKIVLFSSAFSLIVSS